MNTIFCCPDLDIYILYYLDLNTIIQLITISKDQNNLLLSCDFIQELNLLKVNSFRNILFNSDFIPGTNLLNLNSPVTIYSIIINAEGNNYTSILKWIRCISQ